MTTNKLRNFYFPQTIVFLLVIFFLFLVSLSQTNQNYFPIVTTTPSLPLFAKELPVPTATPVPVTGPVKSNAVVDPFLTARAALVIDRASGAVLYAKDEDVPLWPASTTKMMTALVALDEYTLTDVVDIIHPVQEGRIMNLYAGERITVENLLHGLLIHSANDAAYALADHYPLGREGFVEKMNQKAVALNLANTHFADPAGFDNEKQYSTASDLALLTRAALENNTVAHIVSIPSITISDADYVTFHQLKNVNELLGRVPGVAGVKTGWTENAKENLINLTRRNGHEIITVVLGSDDRFGETQALTEWTFANFSWDATAQSTSDQLPEPSP